MPVIMDCTEMLHARGTLCCLITAQPTYLIIGLNMFERPPASGGSPGRNKACRRRDKEGRLV